MNVDANQQTPEEPPEILKEAGDAAVAGNDTKKRPEASDPGNAKLDARQATKREHYYKTVFGGTGDHSTTNIHFAKTQERLEEILHHSDIIPPHVAYPNKDDVNRFAQALVKQHLLRVTYTRRAREDMQSALYSLLEHLRDTHSHLRRFTSNNLKPPELKLFTNHEKGWVETLGDSIIYLDLLDYPDNLTFEFSENLCRELQDARCHLVLVSMSGPNNRLDAAKTMHMRAQIPEWNIQASQARAITIEEIKLDSMDLVTQTLVFAASIAPGLPADSFVRLCNQLLPPPESIRARPSASISSGIGSQTTRTRATPLQRWYAGERDALLRNAGVKLTAAANTAAGQAGSAPNGFYVEDLDTSIQAKAQLFADAPLFLVDKFAPMTNLYFEEQWPSAFCDGYIDFAYRLHASGLHVLTGEWLVEKIARIETGRDTDYGLQQFVRLAYRIADLPQRPNLIADFYRQIAKQIRDEEERWHQKLLTTPLGDLATTVASCTLSADENHENDGISEAAACVIRYRHEHKLDDDFLTLLRRAWFRFIAVLHVAETLHDSGTAIECLRQAIIGPESRERLCGEVGDLPDVHALISPVHGAFLQAAETLVRELPERFLALTEGILEQLPSWNESSKSRPGASASNGDDENGKKTRPNSFAAAEIASNAFLEAFERFLAAHLQTGLSRKFVDSVLAPDQGRRCGQIVFAMLNRCQPRALNEKLRPSPRIYRLDSWRVIRIIEWLCRGLLRRKGKAESSVIPYAIGFGSQVRQQLEPDHMAELIEEAYEYELDFVSRADVYRMLDMHEKEILELQRARLLGMVIRGLTTRAAALTWKK